MTLLPPAVSNFLNGHPSAASPARVGMSAEDDRADAELAAAGDAAAFERLYWRHAARVRALARRLLGPDDVDDGTRVA